jgi:hypothetical protein
MEKSSKDNKIPEEKRNDTLFRITRCCGNCSFFGYYKGKQRRGICLHGYQRPKFSYEKNMYDKYPKTHVTCVCDNHSLRNPPILRKITNWCGAEFIGEE